MPHHHHSTFFSNHHHHNYNYNNRLFLYNSILYRNIHYYDDNGKKINYNNDSIIPDIKGKFNALYNVNQYWYL
jgi:hypothetical protein